jgi:hypothetical protein
VALVAAAFYMLLLAGHLGVFDVIYFHWYRCRLNSRLECQREVFWHTVRHLVYASQFIIIANFRFHGIALLFLAALYALDVIVAWSDVWEETASRKVQGGLPQGEYFMHIVLSLLIGAYIVTVIRAVWPDRLLPAGFVVDPPAVPLILRMYMTVMGIAAIGAFFKDIAGWLRMRRMIAARAGSKEAEVA